MSPTQHRIHQLAHTARAHAGALLAHVPDPHDELLSLVWGPRFDREHALGLVMVGTPAMAAATLPAVWLAAERFDTLGAGGQHRLRQLIARHRARQAMAM